ncbi:MAG: hypothetical protein MJ237_09025 [bacterium]|nr:hypothetical protein [bacterium]
MSNSGFTSKPKYIICDYAASRRGKSGTALKVMDILSKISKPLSSVTHGKSISSDRYEEYVINGVKIAVFSQGDPGSKSYQLPDLKAAVASGADVIICTARSSGDTVDNIYEIAKDYEKIWYRNFYADNWTQQFGDFLNENSAVGVLKLAGNLFNIKALKSL